MAINRSNNLGYETSASPLPPYFNFKSFKTYHKGDIYMPSLLKHKTTQLHTLHFSGKYL